MSNGNNERRDALKEGTLLQNGRYRIVRFLGQGGFGCTYEAIHTMFNERVAIKELFVKEYCNRNNETGVISVGVNSKRDMIGRLHSKFIEEARAQRRMQHPNIVRVIDVFEENSTAYYVMDYIDGDSLERMVVSRRGPMPEHEAVCYIRMVADALAYVHSNLRLHLDLKPGNIMIDRNGKAVLIDFGASKQYDEQGNNKSVVLGYTRGYAPIEQINGLLSVFSPASDIFSLGSTLYRLLSGEVPVDGLSRVSGLTLKPLPAIVTEPTRRAVEKAMSVRINDRPQSISEFLALLNAPARPAYQNVYGSSNSNAGSDNDRTEQYFTEPAGGGGNSNIPPTPPASGGYGYPNNAGEPLYGPTETTGDYNSFDMDYYDDGEPEKKHRSLSGILIFISLMAATIGICLMCMSVYYSGGSGYDPDYAEIDTTWVEASVDSTEAVKIDTTLRASNKQKSEPKIITPTIITPTNITSANITSSKKFSHQSDIPKLAERVSSGKALLPRNDDKESYGRSLKENVSDCNNIGSSEPPSLKSKSELLSTESLTSNDISDTHAYPAPEGASNGDCKLNCKVSGAINVTITKKIEYKK